ncbi:hypothetical protein [Bacillus cereus]|uniref:hypothetical protein n=1 Tax=Bacillus cereus TaxID=1396 RepID=UPI0011A0184B|nr:hypothetical protein [Bacillus cereus]
MVQEEKKAIYKEVTKYREETKRIVTEEKLCKVHAVNVIGKEKCPDCVMYNAEFKTVQIPYTENVFVGIETVIPSNCTYISPPDQVYEPVFKNGEWVKTVDPAPVEPKPQEPSELERIKQQLADIQKELEDIKNQKPPTIDETEVPIAFAAPIQDTPDYEHEINKIKQVIPDLGEQIVDLHSRIADLENKEQV